MRVFVTGVKGQLGYDVMNELEKQGLEGIGVDIDEMDITDADQVNKVIKEAAPDAVIHCAAYTAVDAAEDNEEICRKVNAQGTENIAKVCEELDIKMMYISTDYVFNGQGERPWEPDDKREPLNVYGQTKYEGARSRTCGHLMKRMSQERSTKQRHRSFLEQGMRWILPLRIMRQIFARQHRQQPVNLQFQISQK